MDLLSLLLKEEKEGLPSVSLFRGIQVMKLTCKHSATSHSVFLGHPHKSIVCGVIKK